MYVPTKKLLTYNLSILDFKVHLITPLLFVCVPYNLSILDFKAVWAYNFRARVSLIIYPYWILKVEVIKTSDYGVILIIYPYWILKAYHLIYQPDFLTLIIYLYWILKKLATGTVVPASYL